MVAPFRRYLHSGSIVHALSAGRPVLTPATPFATSLAAELGRPDWLQTYAGPADAGDAGGGAPARDRRSTSRPLAPAKAAARRLRRFLEGLLRGEARVAGGAARPAGQDLSG